MTECEKHGQDTDANCTDCRLYLAQLQAALAQVRRDRLALEARTGAVEGIRCWFAEERLRRRHSGIEPGAG
jgi:hypothetical protein